MKQIAEVNRHANQAAAAPQADSLPPPRHLAQAALDLLAVALAAAAAGEAAGVADRCPLSGREYTQPTQGNTMFSLITRAHRAAASIGRASRSFATASVLLVGAVGLLGGCSTSASSFSSPEAAVESLVAALRSTDPNQVRKVVGSQGQELLESGDEVADANARAEFVRLYDEKHQLTRSDGVARLEIGNTDWPMPIPLVKGDSGWFFDVDAGADEVLSRRIGRNELSAIQVCLAIHDAQREYAAGDWQGDGWREYAAKFASDPGKKNGLYWETKEGEAPSPLGEIAASAEDEGYKFTTGSKHPRPYHGYYYRILKAQGPAAPGGSIEYISQGRMIGGFAVVAWPSEYAGSGLKSFLVSHHGVVYEKDLGDDTDRIARGMTVFNPDAGWAPTANASDAP